MKAREVVFWSAATTAGVGAAIWYLFLRKRVIDVNATVTSPEDEVHVTYRPTVP